MQQEQLDNMQSDIKEMKEALLGTQYGSKGLVYRIKKVEEYQHKDKKQKWMVAGAAVIIGTIVKYWDNIGKIFH